jgi:hypothetical protein
MAQRLKSACTHTEVRMSKVSYQRGVPDSCHPLPRISLLTGAEYYWPERISVRTCSM